MPQRTATGGSGHSSQRTTIWPPDAGQRQRLAPPSSTASRSARRQPAARAGPSHGRVRAAPRPGDLSRRRAGRRARRAVSRARRGGRRPGPAGRDRPPEGAGRHRRSEAAGPVPRARGGAEGRLVAGEDPRIADRCPHRGQRRAERLERRDGVPPADPGPPAEGLGRGGPVDMQVAARELQAGVAGFDLRWRHGPDGRLPRAFPPDQDRAGRRRVPEAVGVHAERAARLARRSSARRPGERAGGRRDPPPAAGPWRRRAASRARTRPGRERPPTKTLNRGPHSWTSDGSSHVDGPVPATRAWIDSSAARGMLSCSPAQAARRSELGPAREPLVERARLPPERQDLRPREVEPGTVHDLPFQQSRTRSVRDYC